MRELLNIREGPLSGRVVFLPGLGDPPSSMISLARLIMGSGAVAILDLNALADDDGDALTVERLAGRAWSILHESGGASALVGYSFGGLVALEMARIARDRGTLVPVPVLIDAAPEQSNWSWMAWVSSMWRRAAKHVGKLSQLPPATVADELRARAFGLGRRLRRRGARTTHPAAQATHSPQAKSPADKMTEAFELYRPEPYDGPVLLLEASDPSFGMPVSLIWKPLTSRLEVSEYPGGHLDAMVAQASLAALARQLNSRLDLGG